MTTLVPARVDRNAFFLQWSEKMSELEKVKDKKRFLELVTESLADVLEMDIGICLELEETKKILTQEPDVLYRVTYIRDTKSTLSIKHPEICLGMEVKKNLTHKYLKGVWSLKMNTYAETIPGVGADCCIPMKLKTVMNVGTFASHLILIDDSETAVDLTAVKSTLREEANKIRRLYNAIENGSNAV